MKVVCIVQQRMNSSRLPGKALLPLGGKSLTQNLLERVKRATKLDAVVLAVPATPENECLWQVAHDAGCDFYWYKGDENDLVGRYLACAKAFDADIIVRLPGDNPCVEPRLIDQAVRIYLGYPYVFFSNTFLRWKDGLFIDGAGCEVLSQSRLRWLDHVTEGQLAQREHPHMTFNHVSQAYTLLQLARTNEIIRLDVNDQRDYDFIRDIYDHFNRNDFTIEEVLAYLDSKVPVG